MKRILILPIILSLAIPYSCTKDFESINTDPTRPSPANFDANYFLSNAQNNYKNAISGYAGPILFQSGWAQIFASTTSGAANYYSNMDKYVQSSNTNSYTANSWNNCYTVAGLAQQIINNLGADASKANVVSAAVIMKVLAILYVTDVYGDCPYTEASLGETGLNQPKYDKQEALLKQMLADLDGAIAKLDPAKAKPTADLYFAGDVAKWKKFGYSLMLKIAMRFSKRDAGTAKTWAEKAYAGGTFGSNADNCFLKGDNANGYSNPSSNALLVPADFYQVRWSKTLIDFLKTTNDPRVSAIAEVPADGLAANNNINMAGDNTYAKQLGLPNGWDLNGGATDITKSPGYPGGTGTGGDFTPIGKYSRPRLNVYLDRNAPVFILTYAETELLLAEAAARGWSVGANAATHYSNGVKAALEALATFSSAAAISSADAAAYAAANPLNVSSQAASLKMINEQIWATTGTLFNWAESWSNWRRSGYPALTPVVYTGNFSGNAVPRRQLYPTNEASVNGPNYQTGVSSLTGGDVWSARVWWDN